MYKNQTVLVTVCARGGSQGVKLKNIRILGGKPLIGYSLDLIKQSKLVDDYIISTDSEEIMEVVKKYGFKIRFKRPKELASGKVSRLEVIKNACKWMEDYKGKRYDVIVDLGVATPFKNVNDMDEAIRILIDNNVPNVFSVTPAIKNPYYNMVEIQGVRVKKVKQLDSKIHDRRDAPKVYEMNDGFNVFKHDILFSDSPQFNQNTKILIMPKERSIDIDEEWDLHLAEFLIQYNENKGK